MSRTVRFRVPADPLLFSPLQLRPRALLALAMRGMVEWLAVHLVPLPRLMSEHRTAAVVSAICLDYVSPQLRLEDSTWLDAVVRGSAGAEGRRMRAGVEFKAGPRTVANLRTEFRMLTLDGTSGLGGVPGRLNDSLLALFQPDELHDDRVADLAPVFVPPVLGPLQAEAEYTTTLHRTHCEVADQWSFVEMVELLTLAREDMYLRSKNEAVSVSRAAISAPVQRISVLYNHALFLFDDCRIVTRAHAQPDGVAFVHRLYGPTRRGPCLVAYEMTSSPTATAASRNAAAAPGEANNSM